MLQGGSWPLAVSGPLPCCCWHSLSGIRALDVHCNMDPAAGPAPILSPAAAVEMKQSSCPHANPPTHLPATACLLAPPAFPPAVATGYVISQAYALISPPIALLGLPCPASWRSTPCTAISCSECSLQLAAASEPGGGQVLASRVGRACLGARFLSQAHRTNRHSRRARRLCRHHYATSSGGAQPRCAALSLAAAMNLS